MLKIYTVACARPDFIGLQIQSLVRNLQEPFDFTVINNAGFNPGRRDYEEIKAECRRQSIRCIETERDEETVKECEKLETTCPVFAGNVYTNANVANAYPLTWAWKFISKQECPILILDSDVFLIRPVTLTDYLKENHLVYIPQARPGVQEYMWNACFLTDLTKIPEPDKMVWYCGSVHGTQVDVGGQTAHYLEAHPELVKMRLHAQPSEFSAEEFLYESDPPLFLHYRSGSNWNNMSQSFHEQKTKWLKERLDESTR